MASEEKEQTCELSNSVLQRIQQIVKQSLSLFGKNAEELETVLTTLAALPFKDEVQLTSFLEQLQRLQGYHIIQVFNFGVVPLKKSVAGSSGELLEEVIRLFEICFSFCYITDVSKRVAFEYYVRALKFCFPSEPKQCLSTAVVSKLLELVQIFQEGELAEIVFEKSMQDANSKWQIHGASYFFGELLKIFESRRREDCLVEVIEQTVRFASVDAKGKCIRQHAIGEVTFRSKHVVSPVFLVKWMELLKLMNVSNGFAFSLAKVDSRTLSCTEKTTPLFLGSVLVQRTNLNYQSTIFCFVNVLEEMKRNGDEVNLPHGKERLDIFFNCLNHFCDYPNMTATSLKLLATTSVSNQVLREVLDQFFYTDGVDLDVREIAFELIFKALSFLPDGVIVKKVLKFWRETCFDDLSYQTLVSLWVLLGVKESNSERVGLQERAARTLDFLERLPRPIVLLVSFWQRFFSCFTRIFPNSFQSRPEVLDFIQQALQTVRAVQGPTQQRQADAVLEQVPGLQLLEWLSQQSCSEELKSEMIRLLMCSSDRAVYLNSVFETGVIKSLSLCSRMSFNTKIVAVFELSNLAPFFKEGEKMVLMKIIENVASNQTFEILDEVVFEFLDFIKRFVVHQKSEDALEFLSLLSRVSFSSERREKVMQLSKTSRQGLLNGLRILQLIEKHQCVIQERTNKYFDLLFAAIVKTLEGNNDLCERLYIQSLFRFPSSNVLNVWTFVVAGLLSLGLFKEEIDSRCCRRILQKAVGFRSPFAILQLLTQVRSTAGRVVHLSSRSQVESTSSCNSRQALQESSAGETDLLENFVASVTTILGTAIRDILSSREKILLVRKACDVVLANPNILTRATLRNALRQCLPLSSNENSNSAFSCIAAVMENPKVLVQLSRIPESALRNVLFDVFSTKMSANSFFNGNLVDIFLFIGSINDFDQGFFDHLLPFLEMTIQESMSLEHVLEILKELVHVFRNIRSEIIPIMMSSFGYLLQNSVDKQGRDIFLSDIAMSWELSPSHNVLSFLEVPRLLWKAYNTASTAAKRSEMVDRVQQILKKSGKVEDWVIRNPLYPKSPRDYIRRQIACCELEWLVLHSSLSTEDAALAFDLSCLPFQRVVFDHLRCFTFSEAEISEDGAFKFVPDKDTGTTSGAAVASAGNSYLATEPQKHILTPVLVAKEVICHLKRVLGQDKDLSENAFSLWEFVFEQKIPVNCREAECVSNYPILDGYVKVFLSILAGASSIEMVFHWARLDKHHVCQCSEVIQRACKWKGDDIDKDALLKLQSVVSTTLEKMRLNTSTITPPWAVSVAAPCFRLLNPQLTHMRNMLESRLPIEVTKGVLELYQINIQAGVTVGEIVSLWSCKQQSLKLVEDVKSFCEGDEISSLNPAQRAFAWQLLKAYGRLCMNSCEDLITKFKELIVLHDPEDTYGLNRLPKWREIMIADGFPVQVIDSWCAAFLMTPLDDLTSRDVDAIVDLNSRSLQLIAPVSQIVEQVIFPQDGFQVTQGKGIKESCIKELIRLARLLGEFINILKVRKPGENPKDAVVRDIVVNACAELCSSHENANRRRNDLYKIHGQKLKALFTEIFGKRRKGEDGRVSIQDCGVIHQEGKEQELRVALSLGRQSSYLHENLPTVLSHTQVYEPMLVLLRRWLSGINKKPSLGSYTLEIVQLLFSLNPSDAGPDLLQESHGIIQTHILSLERNQSLMAQLQAAGYNQKREGIHDLWSSRAVELPCYLSKRESPNSRLFTKKLTKVLRPLWNEWKDILFMFCIASIKVGEDEVCTKDLFGVHASLDEMEKQAAAVKEVIKQINLEYLDRRVNQLMRLEQQHRARIEKLYKSNRDSVTCGEVKKFVAVWENRFLEQVKMCSERIPGCYAPNGFHSEKPVICALSVDNRILTVFKEEKPGHREEVENVEVKLFEAGLYVYGLHTSGHDYVTDELWAAFYKMLLEDRLVPSVVLSNESPGFDWIKTFVQPTTSHPCPWKWELHGGIVPREEDYFDYLPISAAVCPTLYGLEEFLTLTRDNVCSLKFKDFKDAHIVEGRENQIKEMAGKAIQELQRELELLHGDNEKIRKALAGKLTFAVKETVKGIIDGVQPTEETVKELIDMEKLAYRHPEMEKTKESRQQYAAAVLRACEHARRTITLIASL